MNLIEAPARKRIYPFPWNKAPPGQPLPMHTGSKETQNAPHTSSHTHPRGHSNIIRYKPIIQAISLSLMMCQHSLSVFFFFFLFLSCIANFLFTLSTRKCSRSLLHSNHCSFGRSSAGKALTGGQKSSYEIFQKCEI